MAKPPQADSFKNKKQCSDAPTTTCNPAEFIEWTSLLSKSVQTSYYNPFHLPYPLSPNDSKTVDGDSALFASTPTKNIHEEIPIELVPILLLDNRNPSYDSSTIDAVPLTSNSQREKSLSLQQNGITSSINIPSCFTANKDLIVPPSPSTAVQSNPTTDQTLVEVRISYRSRRYRPKKNKRNASNLIRVRRCNPVETNKVTKPMLPKFALINARSLLPKVDELIANLSVHTVNLVAVTETWLNDDIEDNLVSISGYNIFRRDRPYRRGGGVCVYLSEHIHAKRRTDLESDNFECLWLWLRPTRLPRPLSGMAVCVVYHPPGLPEHQHYLLNEYLTNSADILRNQYPSCGLVFLGDFNDFQTSNLLSRHNLKQLIQAPTRGSAILDLIITNLSNLYEAPQVLAPLGSSDHNIVTWSPDLTKSNPSLHTKSIKRLVRRYPRSCIDAFGRWATTHDWFTELGSTATVDDLTTSHLTSQFVQAIDRIFPPKLVKFHHSDKPWVTPS